MIAAFDWTPILTGIISFVFGGGLIAAIVALYKVKPEAGQIVVTAAQGALLVQTGVIENLQKEIKRIQADYEREITQLKEQHAREIAKLQSEIDTLRTHQIRHDTEIKGLSNGKH